MLSHPTFTSAFARAEMTERHRRADARRSAAQARRAARQSAVVRRPPTVSQPAPYSELLRAALAGRGVRPPQ